MASPKQSQLRWSQNPKRRMCQEWGPWIRLPQNSCSLMCLKRGHSGRVRQSGQSPFRVWAGRGGLVHCTEPTRLSPLFRSPNPDSRWTAMPQLLTNTGPGLIRLAKLYNTKGKGLELSRGDRIACKMWHLPLANKCIDYIHGNKEVGAD